MREKCDGGVVMAHGLEGGVEREAWPGGGDGFGRHLMAVRKGEVWPGG